MNPAFRTITKARAYVFNAILITTSLIATACRLGGSLPSSTLSGPPAYMTALSQALEVCKHVATDQVCYGHGTITVEPHPNIRLESFTQPGDILALAGVTGLQLEAASSDEDLGVAVMRLQADFNDEEKYLTVVVMGDTQLSHIDVTLEDLPPLTIAVNEGDPTQATPEAAPVDDPVAFEPLQGFNFSSGPLSDDPADAPNGLLMWTTVGDETASIALNSTIITLGSTAFVHAQPGGQMTVAMLEGTTLVTTADGQSGIAEGGTQISVPLGENSSGDTLVRVIRDPRAEAVAHAVAQYVPEPLDPRAEAVAHAVAQYAPEPLDPRAEAVSHAVAQYVIMNDPRAEAIARAVDQYPDAVAQDIKTRYQRAIDRCTDPENPQLRYVYNVLYFYNLIHAFEDPDMLDAFRRAGLAELEARAGSCLSFELDFDSTIYTDNNVLQSTSHVRAEGVKLEFAPNGDAKSESYPLQYLSFETKNIAADACPVGSYDTVDGTFQVMGGGLKIDRDQLRLTIEIAPVGATENLVFACPIQEVAVPDFIHWRTHFAIMHGSEQLEIDRFAIRNWKFTGNGEHFAEAIYETSFSAGAQIDESTFLVMVHTPQR